MARWSELLFDLLEVIERHIGRYDDKIRFRCVCTHFRQSVSDFPVLRQQQPPWLLLPYKTGSMCGLYDPLENKLIDIDLPEAGEKVFKGTGHGWVVTQQLNGSIDVLNPLTRVRVQLPPRYEFPDVLKYDPDNIGEEYLFDIRSCPRLRKCEVPPFRREFDRDYDKLVNSPDSLVMVRRVKTTRKIKIEGGYNEYVWYTVGFEMYRLDVDPNTTTGWIRIKSLDDDEILFMGLGTHILFSFHDFIGNQIYFASDRLNPKHGDIEDCFDNGVFDFEDGSFKPLGNECNSRVIWPSPIWFTPGLY